MHGGVLIICSTFQIVVLFKVALWNYVRIAAQDSRVSFCEGDVGKGASIII